MSDIVQSQCSPKCWCKKEKSDEYIYSKEIDPIYHGRKVGVVFQKPNPFPTMSIFVPQW